MRLSFILCPTDDKRKTLDATRNTIRYIAVIHIQHTHILYTKDRVRIESVCSHKVNTVPTISTECHP